MDDPPYQRLVDAVDDGLSQIDEDGRIVALNESLARATGYERDELVGSHISILLDDPDLARFRREARTDDSNDRSSIDLVLKTATGTPLPCHMEVQPLSENGDADGALVIAHGLDDAGELGASRAAVEERQSLANILDEARVAVIVLDATFKVVWADETVERYLGVDRDAIIGEDKRPLIDDVKTRFEDPDRFERRIEAAYADNSYIDRFEVHIPPDQAQGRKERFLEHWSKPIESGPYEGGRIELYYDITDQKRSQGALKESERAFTSLVDAVEEYAIFRLDRQGRIASWNQGARRIKGYEEDEILGEHVSTFYTDEDRLEGIPERNLKRAEGQGSVEDEGWRVRKDGTRFWANVTITRLEDEHGNHEGFLKVTRDMTDRREREKSLKRERDIVQQILDTSPVGLMVVDPDGSAVQANDRMAEILGLDPHEMTSYTLGEKTVYDEEGDPLQAHQRPAQRAIETGEPASRTNLRVQANPDQERWLTVNAAPVLDENGNVAHAVVAATDITQLKVQAQRLERQRDDLLRELDEMFDRVDDAFYAIDRDWRFTYVNEELANLANGPRSELVGANIWDTFPELADTEFAELDRHAMRTGERVEYELFYEPADAWLEVSVYPSETGQSVYLKDITDRKRTRDRLEQRAIQQATVAELGKLALETDDLDELMHQAAQRVADVLDNAYCKVLDLDPANQELLLRQGVGWKDGYVGHATVASNTNSQAGYTLLSEEPVVVEALDEETRFSGPELLTHHDVVSGISTIIGPPDAPWGILGTHDTEHRSFTQEDVAFVQSVANILADAIEREDYERELESTIQQLEESNKRLEQFAYAASHDLQEPLRMVSSYLRLVENRYEDELDDEADEFIQFAVDGADRMRKMVNGLLQYSRIDTEGEPLQPVHAETIIEDTLADLEVQIQESGATVQVEELPRVWADPDQLRQLFQNLISNALKYSGEEPPRVRISATREGSEVAFAVEDEGIGIEPRERDRIFDVFQRAHPREEGTGTGIGLAICERIIERHGGRIWVESEPGEGTTFRFTLSAAEEAP